MKDVPAGVRVIACLYLVSSILVLALLVFSWPALPKEHRPPLWFVAVTAAIPLLLIWVAVGLYQLRRWAWWMSMMLTAFNLIVGALQFSAGFGFVEALKLVLFVLILWYLWQPSTRARFK